MKITKEYLKTHIGLHTDLPSHELYIEFICTSTITGSICRAYLQGEPSGGGYDLIGDTMRQFMTYYLGKSIKQDAISAIVDEVALFSITIQRICGTKSGIVYKIAHHPGKSDAAMCFYNSGN